MKHIYIFTLAFASILSSAQIQISFEESEGYTTGNLHTQNGWEVTEGSDGIIQNQTVSDEQSSDGTYSFKNGYEPDYDFQWFPIFGGAYTLENPVDYEETITFSYNILVTGQNGADFEFTLYGIDENEEFSPIAGVGIENRGFIYFINSSDYDFEYAQAEWSANEWVNVAVEISSTQIKYYINNTLDTTIDRFNDLDVLGFNFLHNNYGNDAYYDAIALNYGTMQTQELSTKSLANLYPNPAKEFVKIALENDAVEQIEFYNNSGKLVKKSSKTNEMQISELPVGIYFLKIITEKGVILNKKLIKK